MLRVTVLCYFTKCRTLTYCGFTRYRMKDSNTQKFPKISTFSWQNETLQPPGGGRSNCFPQNFGLKETLQSRGGRAVCLSPIFLDERTPNIVGKGWVGLVGSQIAGRPDRVFTLSPQSCHDTERASCCPPHIYIYIHIYTV